MEVGDRSRLQGETLARAIVDADPQAMLDKIEIDLEGARAIGDWCGGETRSGEVERYLPPVIDHRRLHKRILPMICVHMWNVARVSSQAASGKLGQSSGRDAQWCAMMALLHCPTQFMRVTAGGVYEGGGIRT
jgi:hypothetical protein